MRRFQREIQSTITKHTFLLPGQPTLRWKQQVASTLNSVTDFHFSDHSSDLRGSKGTQTRPFSEDQPVIMWGAVCSTFVC